MLRIKKLMASVVMECCSGSRDNPAVGDDGEHTAAFTAELFDSVPKSWLSLFIRSLPADSRFAMFAASRHFAQLVLHNAAKVKLSLLRVTEGDIHTRRMTITSLLDGCMVFTLHLSLSCQQPYPVALCGRIDELYLSSSKHNDATDFSWGNFPNLQRLKLDVTDSDVYTLCDAIQAGLLSALCHVKVNESGPRKPEAIQQFAAALSPQISSLCCGPTVWRHLDILQFTKLQSLKLQHCELTAEGLQALCQHPTLRHLSLSDVYTDALPTCAKLQPRWGVLKLKCTDLYVLSAIHTTHVNSIILKSPICDADALALAGVFDSPANKLVCEPAGNPKAHILDGLNAATLQLVRYLQPDSGVLVLRGEHEQPHLLPALWAALPTFIHTISYHVESDIDISSFWTGFPSFVNNTLFGVQLTVQFPGLFEELQAKAPPHVHCAVEETGYDYYPSYYQAGVLIDQ